MVLGANAQGYSLKATVEGIADGTKVVLVPMSHDKEDPIAEAVVSGGKFSMTGKVEFPRAVFLMVKDSYGVAEFMLENADITLTVSATNGKAHDGTDRYSFSNLKVTGSPLSDRLFFYLAKREALDKSFEENRIRFADISKKIANARMAKDKALCDSLINSEEGKAMDAAEKLFFETVEKTFTDAINENLDTFWGPLLTLNYYTYLTPEQQTLYNSFSEEAKQSWYGKKVRSEVFPGADDGGKAKPFTVDDNGTVKTLEQLCQDKRYVLLDFWASWCGPCRREIPNVKRQYELYKDKGFEVISISIDKSEAAWRKAVEEEKLLWPNFIDKTNVAKTYSVRSVPSMFLIDTTTMDIIASGDAARGEKLANKLAELF